MLTILLVFPVYLSLPAFGSGILDLVLIQSFLQSYIVRIERLSQRCNRKQKFSRQFLKKPPQYNSMKKEEVF